MVQFSISIFSRAVPYICSYQKANYTFVVLEKSTSNNFEEGPFQYVDRDEEHIRIKIQDGLRPNWNYTATVIVETVAGSINSSISFSKPAHAQYEIICNHNDIKVTQPSLHVI